MTDAKEVRAAGRAGQTGAMFVKRLYEVDPLRCPRYVGATTLVY